jgi:hypothetical protein
MLPLQVPVDFGHLKHLFRSPFSASPTILCLVQWLTDKPKHSFSAGRAGFSTPIWGNVMNATRAMVVVVGLLLAARPAGAMTGQEFLQVSDKSAVDEMAVLKPLVRQFVREGYHSVPDWAELSEMVRALILEKGYRDEDLAEIAREAAIANGMSK